MSVGHYFTSSSDLECVRGMKEKMSYHALDFKAELETSKSTSLLEKTFEMPDFTSITLGSERFRASEVHSNIKCTESK